MDAPSIIPGISATTNVLKSLYSTIPKFGFKVVNSYSPIFGFADVIEANNVDFPAFGKPTNPTSAKIFNSRVIVISFPETPF